MTIRLFKNKHIVLGVTGGIAAYKIAALTSRLVQGGAAVDVVMTGAATKFVTPLTFQALTHRRVYTDIFDIPPNENIPHIALADSIDLLVIAPATANTIAKIANGLADNLLTTLAIATQAPILMAPAMETDMWLHPATQRNVSLLREYGIQLVGPAEGRLASGARGAGRMVEPVEIYETIRSILARKGTLLGKKVMVTAGGTREAIDPVRYITNHSSGKMGYAIAEIARDRGAEVTLVSTTTELPLPVGIERVLVHSAADMAQAVMDRLAETDILVMSAAVADYRSGLIADQKIKKSADELVLPLTRNDDILKKVQERRPELGAPKMVVGFAAESQNIVRYAADKLKRKGLDFIVANDISRSDTGFRSDNNLVTIIDRAGDVEKLPLMSKLEVAEVLWDKVYRQIKKTGIR